MIFALFKVVRSRSESGYLLKVEPWNLLIDSMMDV